MYMPAALYGNAFAVCGLPISRCCLTFNAARHTADLRFTDTKKPQQWRSQCKRMKQKKPTKNKSKSVKEVKLLRIRFLNRSYHGTPPFRCSESRPYHEEPRLKTSFYPILPALATLFLHCSPMVTLTSLPALSLQHTEAELYSGRRRRGAKQWISQDCGRDEGIRQIFSCIMLYFCM